MAGRGWAALLHTIARGGNACFGTEDKAKGMPGLLRRQTASPRMPTTRLTPLRIYPSGGGIPGDSAHVRHRRVRHLWQRVPGPAGRHGHQRRAHAAEQGGQLPPSPGGLGEGGAGQEALPRMAAWHGSHSSAAWLLPGHHACRLASVSPPPRPPAPPHTPPRRLTPSASAFPAWVPSPVCAWGTTGGASGTSSVWRWRTPPAEPPTSSPQPAGCRPAPCRTPCSCGATPPTPPACR